MQTEFVHRTTQVGKAKIFYETGGDGPALVLLHGLSGSSRWWRKNMRALARNFRVYVIDLIGFGQSRGQPFILEETAGLIAAWMDIMQVERALEEQARGRTAREKTSGRDETSARDKDSGRDEDSAHDETSGRDEVRFHLVGHSMGGLVAAELAAQRPERVAHLVLVDTAALPPGQNILNSALRLLPALAYMPLDFLPVLLGDALRAGARTLLRATFAIHQADIRANLGNIAARTLIVWGEHDMLVPVSAGLALHQALPGSEFHVVRGAGHNPMWDRAEEFNRVVQAFLMEPKRI